MFNSSTPAIRWALRGFLSEVRGTTSIEYALIASGVSIVIVGTVTMLGSNVANMYSAVATALK